MSKILLSASVHLLTLGWIVHYVHIKVEGFQKLRLPIYEHVQCSLH